MSVRLLAIVSLLALAPQSDLATFQNHNRTFQLELPADWRLLAPNEAVQLREAGGAPPDLQRSEPRYFYAVGPVERWLKGELDGAWLHVVEVNEAWYIEDDFRDQLREGWRARGEQTGTRHELEDVHLEKLGTQQVESVVATRTSTPKDGAPYRVLEVHVPTARQQLSLSFGCHPDDFERWAPRFRDWLATLTLARVADEKATLPDRLWTPIVTGLIVGVILLALYRHTRGRR